MLISEILKQDYIEVIEGFTCRNCNLLYPIVEM
jgi:hypothetical protein